MFPFSLKRIAIATTLSFTANLVHWSQQQQKSVEVPMAKPTFLSDLIKLLLHGCGRLFPV